MINQTQETTCAHSRHRGHIPLAEYIACVEGGIRDPELISYNLLALG